MNSYSGRLESEARSTYRQRVIVLGMLLALLWGIEAVNWLLGGKLAQYGIRPRELGGLWGIVFAPFLHGGWGHLAANSVTLLVLSWFVLLRGIRDYLEVSAVIILCGGFGTWLIGKPHSVHLGASGLIFGYFGFLILRGFIDLSLRSILSGLGVGLLYGGLIWGLLPVRPGISWAGHLCGLLAGFLSAWLLGRMGGGKQATTLNRRTSLLP